MAPKGGGKGGGGGGGRGGKGGGCSNCLKSVQLAGSDWESNVTTAFFAVDVTVAVVLLICLIIQTRFKWVKDLSVDKLRNTGYKTAVATQFLAYVIYIVDLALREEDTNVVYIYYILYIFASGFWRIADILILGIIYRTIAESSINNLARKLSKFHKLLVIILALISIVAYGIYIAQIVAQIRGTYESEGTYWGYQYGSIAYQAFYLLAALLAGAESLLVMLRARSKATLIMLTIVTPCLILHNLFSLIGYAVITAQAHGIASTRNATYKIQWACSFISELTNIGIYLGVVLIGWLTFCKGASKSGKYVGAGTANGEYVSDTSYQPVQNTWGR